MKTVLYKKGHILFREGDKSAEMYYIDSGSIAILVKNTTTGEQVPVNVLRKGNFLGEFAFFDNEVRSATAMVVEDTSLKVINKVTISSVGKNGLFIIKALIKKLKKMNEIVISNDSEAA